MPRAQVELSGDAAGLPGSAEERSAGEGEFPGPLPLHVPVLTRRGNGWCFICFETI